MRVGQNEAPTPKKNGTSSQESPEPTPFPVKILSLGGNRSKLWLLAARRLCTVTLRELLKSTSGINEFLLTSKKRMAARTDTDLDLFHCGASVIDSPTGAGNDGL